MARLVLGFGFSRTVCVYSPQLSKFANSLAGRQAFALAIKRVGGSGSTGNTRARKKYVDGDEGEAEDDHDDDDDDDDDGDDMLVASPSEGRDTSNRAFASASLVADL